jgi:hypothetical protein
VYTSWFGLPAWGEVGAEGDAPGDAEGDAGADGLGDAPGVSFGAQDTSIPAQSTVTRMHAITVFNLFKMSFLQKIFLLTKT